ncbi:methyltransferase [Gracilibacillus boraciitolerans JCM 21714]|uniref:Methyltransferase n=1 Tax=Gracilibacillus boraciitolerans JCM 21714 TaxID=1298598 RepID=W4VNN6_9BACI|nr:methyltransferase [Gracilibacillus boraciitolerans JCM 21714]
MKQNKYDDPHFFSAYENMPRSAKGGLEAAGEWYALKEMLPDLEDKHVLDLGCGFGWHCRYVRENGAASVTGVDISNKMLEKANRMTEDNAITYIKLPIEEIDFEVEQFDLVFSSLAFHYIQNFDSLCEKVYKYLAPKGGNFVFSVEHPIFTARSEQDWYYDMEENPLHWPLDHYHSEGGSGIPHF